MMNGHSECWHYCQICISFLSLMPNARLLQLYSKKLWSGTQFASSYLGMGAVHKSQKFVIVGWFLSLPQFLLLMWLMCFMWLLL
jgi:hypothetical protein